MIVVSGSGPSLLSRNWLKHLQLDWKQIRTVNVEISLENTPEEILHTLLNKHKDIFRDELGTAI